MEQAYANGERNTVLLGDSGYPLEKWLIVPFKEPTEPEKIFNNKHAKARNPIERCNGVLKGVFRCLTKERKLRYEPSKVIKIVNVCCALHNIRLFYNMEIVEEDFYEEELSDDDEVEDEDESAFRIRQNIFDSL